MQDPATAASYPIRSGHGKRLTWLVSATNAITARFRMKGSHASICRLTLSVISLRHDLQLPLCRHTDAVRDRQVAAVLRRRQCGDTQTAATGGGSDAGIPALATRQPPGGPERRTRRSVQYPRQRPVATVLRMDGKRPGKRRDC
jgi:hypothetical protein